MSTDQWQWNIIGQIDENLMLELQAMAGANQQPSSVLGEYVEQLSLSTRLASETQYQHNQQISEASIRHWWDEMTDAEIEVIGPDQSLQDVISPTAHDAHFSMQGMPQIKASGALHEVKDLLSD